MQEKVARPTSTLSTLIFKNLPIEFPIASKMGLLQKCRGKFGSLIHTGVLVIEILFGLNYGNHGVMNIPSLPQNHGPR